MANIPEHPPKKAPIRLEYLRERRKKRKIRLGIGITVVLAGVLFYITGLYGASMALLIDSMDTVAMTLTPGVGWPSKTGMSSVVDAKPIDGGFIVLGEDDLMLYSDNGNQLRSIQHGFARPSVSVGKTRFCLYSRTGTELRVENRSRTLYTKNFDQAILAAEIAQNNSVAVLTRSARYTGELIVYDREFAEIFHWYATDSEGTPYLLSFSDNSKDIAVACLASSGGVLGLNIELLNVTKSEPTATISLQNCKGYQIKWVDSETLFVLTDQYCALYDKTGAEKAKYSYVGKSLQTADVQNGTAALLFENGELLILDVRNGALKQTAQTSFVNASMVSVANKGVCVVVDHTVHMLGLDGETQYSRTFQWEPVGIVNAKQLMILYGSEVDVLSTEDSKNDHAASSDSAEEPSSTGDEE